MQLTTPHPTLPMTPVRDPYSTPHHPPPGRRGSLHRPPWYPWKCVEGLMYDPRPTSSASNWWLTVARYCLTHPANHSTRLTLPQPISAPPQLPPANHRVASPSRHMTSPPKHCNVAQTTITNGWVQDTCDSRLPYCSVSLFYFLITDL